MDVVALLDREHLAAHDASIHDPSGGRKAQDDVAKAEPDDGVDRHRQQDERERELDVGDAHEHARGPALDESGDEPKCSAHQRRQHDRAAANEQRQPRAVQDAGEKIAAELIGAEHVAGSARRLEALREIGVERIVRGEPGRAERREQRRQREAEAEPFLQRERTTGAVQCRRTRGSSQA
jgi:hypothetical protein